MLSVIVVIILDIAKCLPPPTWRSCKCNQVGLFVSGSVCEQDYHKSNQPISWYYDWVYQSEELINFGGDLFQIRISYHFSTSLIISELNSSKTRTKYLSYSHRPNFTTLSEMPDANEVTNPQYFASDLANIRIGIQIRIPNHFRLRLDVLAEVCAL